MAEIRNFYPEFQLTKAEQNVLNDKAKRSWYKLEKARRGLSDINDFRRLTYADFEMLSNRFAIDPTTNNDFALDRYELIALLDSAYLLGFSAARKKRKPDTKQSIEEKEAIMQTTAPGTKKSV